MSFWGCEFLLNDISSKAFNLMLYNTEESSQGKTAFPSFHKVHEVLVPGHYQSYFYGQEQNEPLTFTLTFGLEPRMLDRGAYLSHDEISVITSWLMGSGGYQKFEVVQDDMIGYHYMVRVSELTLLTNGLMPYGFSCVFTCDSPFAYTEESEDIYSVSGEDEITLWSDATYNGYYYPNMRITKTGDGDVSITNNTDNNHEFSLTDVKGGHNIFIDNNKQVIINETTRENMYSHFNFCFFRMIPGENLVTLRGSYEITFLLRFPVNIGA